MCGINVIDRSKRPLPIAPRGGSDSWSCRKRHSEGDDMVIWNGSIGNDEPGPNVGAVENDGPAHDAQALLPAGRKLCSAGICQDDAPAGKISNGEVRRVRR